MLEYECLKQHDFFTVTRNIISDDAIIVFVHNMRSLFKHIDNIVRDNRIINNDIIGCTETNQSIRFYLKSKRNIELVQY